MIKFLLLSCLLTVGSAVQYELKTSGTCSAYISTKSQCSAAARALGLSDTSAEDDRQSWGVSYDPKGCYYEGGRLKHHDEGRNTGSCTDSDKCLCKKAIAFVNKPFNNGFNVPTTGNPLREGDIVNKCNLRVVTTSQGSCVEDTSGSGNYNNNEDCEFWYKGSKR